jgi:hypothetical protein
VRSVILAVGAGIAFSMSSVFTKTVAVDWSRHVSLADLSSLAAIGVFATAGMLLSQASYRGAGLEAPLATLTVVNPVGSASRCSVRPSATARPAPRSPWAAASSRRAV